jgi:hypothetical protein
MGVNDRERFFGDRRAEQWRPTGPRTNGSTGESTPPRDPENGREQREGDERRGEATIRTTSCFSAISAVAELAGWRSGRADPKRRTRRRRSHGDGRGRTPARPRHSVGTRRRRGRGLGTRTTLAERTSSMDRSPGDGAHTILARARR